MLKKERHCKTISVVPSVATTGVQLKYELLGEVFTFVESVYRSGAWGILFSKGGTGS